MERMSNWPPDTIENAPSKAVSVLPAKLQVKDCAPVDEVMADLVVVSGDVKSKLWPLEFKLKVPVPLAARVAVPSYV